MKSYIIVFLYAMRVNKRVVDIYERDFSVLMDRLKSMSKSHRFEIYESLTKALLPKSDCVVHLEDLVSSKRHDYLPKFKKSFLIVGTKFLSTSHFGEYNQEYFIKKIKFGSQKYPQKVIIALSMMGYIKGLSCNYSKGHHGYLYDVDYWKYKGWGNDFFVDMDLGETTDSPCSSSIDSVNPVSAGEWLWEKQVITFRLMRVDEDFYSHVQAQKDSILGRGVSRDKMSSVDLKKLSLINDVENLYHKTDRCLNPTIDGDDGRFYSIMTGLKSNVRHGNILSIEGVGFKEVDLSNSKPALLGLMVKKKLEEKGIEFNSMWLKHALSGDFYEWLVDITHLIDYYSVDDIIRNLEDKVSRLGKSKNKKVVEQAREIEDLVCKVKSETSSDPHKKLRPLVKHWNETYIYDEIIWNKKHPEPKKNKPNETASPLARKLQEEEVRFIKQCLRNLDKEVEYLYTIHDCIGCLETDVEIVKQGMSNTAIDYYGVALNLKVE